MMIFSWDVMVYFFIGSMIISMIRIIIGPSSADRLIGLNLVSAQILAIFVLIATKENRVVYLDVAMVYAIFGFVGMLAITRYLEKMEKQQ
jgi:multisubunit Na+/H+ antiporter MnhF subunit